MSIIFVGHLAKPLFGLQMIPVIDSQASNEAVFDGLMLILDDIKIYLYTQPNGHIQIHQYALHDGSETLLMDPASGHLFMFRSRTGNKIKARRILNAGLSH